MNFTTNKRQSKAGQYGLATAGALLLGLLATVSTSSTGLAEAENRQSGSGSPGDDGDGGGFAADDEFIGTLPTHGRDEVDPMLPTDAPGFYVSGPREETMNAVLGSTGSGYAVIEVVTPAGEPGDEGPHPDDVIEVTWIGQVDVTLDAGLMTSLGVSMGMNPTNPTGSTYTVAMTEHELLVETMAQADSNVAMDLGAFAAAGHLDEGIHILTSSRLLGRDQINVSSFGGVLSITQGAPLGM
jgi:hypothetical protein